MSIEPSRQTLARHEEIKVPFDVRKAHLRKDELDGGDSRMLAQRNQRLTAENQRLREENERYRERLARWAYNAFRKKGLRRGDLEEEMPEADRERSVKKG